MILNQPANMLAVVDLPNNAVHSDTKMAIARYCASLILPGQTIIMDAGSTVYYVAQQLVSKHPIVVTNSLPISNLYSGYSQVETHVVGGVIYPRLGVLTGPKAEEGFASIHADVAIMGAAGLTLNEGLTNTHALLIDMQLTMIRSARKVFFCMDSTKLGNSSLFYLCKTDIIRICLTVSSCPIKSPSDTEFFMYDTLINKIWISICSSLHCLTIKKATTWNTKVRKAAFRAVFGIHIRHLPTRREEQ